VFDENQCKNQMMGPKNPILKLVYSNRDPNLCGFKLTKRTGPNLFFINELFNKATTSL
jgi:hypothetical protein